MAKKKRQKSKAKGLKPGAASSVGKKTASATREPVDEHVGQEFCTLVEAAPREFARSVHPSRVRAILRSDKKWVNGTVLHYYFFDRSGDGEHVYSSNGRRQWRTWTSPKAQKDAVREAFDTWAKVGIGLEFKEVKAREDAEIRIGFMRGDGSWSYIGRDVLRAGPNERTMNFGWDLTRRPTDVDTAVHEIGHTLGFPHEHQNPNAGIVWNEDAVYASLGGPPNNWSRDTTYRNIIRKIDPDEVQGSNWDPDSIMHYPFAAGLIDSPSRYQTRALRPAPGLSNRDKTWVKTFYPPLRRRDYRELKLLEPVRLDIGQGEQINLVIKPSVTREYDISTFGESDTVMVLFEDRDGELRYLSGDDDSGESFNASFSIKLVAGRRYVLRVRLYYSHRAGETALMMW